MKKALRILLYMLVIGAAVGILLLHIQWTKKMFLYSSPQYTLIYEHRKNVVKSVCEKNQLNTSSFALDKRVSAQLFVEHSHKFIYCEVPKVGCSNWKRVILLLNESLGLTMDTVKQYNIHTSPLLIKLSSYPPSTQKQLLANYTKVMVVRDPLERVVSAFRDKFLHKLNIYYSRTVTDKIKKVVRKKISTEDITFEEFTQYIVAGKPQYADVHWKTMHNLCDPCKIHYDFFGKIETINRDADFILKFIGAPKYVSYPSVKYFNESRTNNEITKQYLESLLPSLLSQLVKVYSVDFSMFEYNPYRIINSQQ